MIRRLRAEFRAWQVRRQLEWERRHVRLHPDGNFEVHGASIRAMLRWYNRQHWPSEWRVGPPNWQPEFHHRRSP